MPVHEGHRSRKKEQFRAHGLDAFADHEVLELLLYYAVPRWFLLLSQSEKKLHFLRTFPSCGKEPFTTPAALR